jgi:DNA-binding beta-propeller fold protein YncE
MGYTRDPNNHRYCKVEGEEPHLLFSNRYDMRKMGLHTGKYNPVLDKLKAAIGLDFDYNDKKVYYTDVALEQIMVADIIENKVNNRSSILIKNSINTPDGLALDWIHKNLYWTDTGLDTIELLSLSGNYRKTLFNTDLDEPRAIVVDPRENQGYVIR